MDSDLSVLTALRQVELDRGIKLEVVVAAIEEAVRNAYERMPSHQSGARVQFDRKRGHFAVLVPVLNDAGEPVGEIDDTPSDFSRLAAGMARQIITQYIRKAEDERRLGEFLSEKGDIVLGTVQQDRESRTVRVDLGTLEAIMPQAEQVPKEDYSHGRKLRVYITDVRKEPRGIQVVVSRTHPGLVQRLFAHEVPEIAQGVVEIKAIARQAGHRTKIAVWSNSPDVSAKGACIGPMGQRVRAVVHELDEEKIDIVDWSDDPVTFIGNALSPARVTSVSLVDLVAKQARVVVPAYQLSLAIGAHGQNSDLAVRLTGWRIQVVPDTPADESGDAASPAAPGVTGSQTPGVTGSQAGPRVTRTRTATGPIGPARSTGSTGPIGPVRSTGSTGPSGAPA